MLGDFIKRTGKAPIAVFDSGVGGISVLRELIALMPQENFYYYGDSANAPYGTKGLEEVRKLTMDHVDTFIRERIEKEEKRLEEQKGILLTKLLDGVVFDRDYKRKHDELDPGNDRRLFGWMGKGVAGSVEKSLSKRTAQKLKLVLRRFLCYDTYCCGEYKPEFPRRS